MGKYKTILSLLFNRSFVWTETSNGEIINRIITKRRTPRPPLTREDLNKIWLKTWLKENDSRTVENFKENQNEKASG